MPDLLTVDKTTYTGDTRFKSFFSYPNNWRLEMKNVQKKDSGLYVCQIATHPPVGLHTVVRVRGEIFEKCVSAVYSSNYDFAVSLELHVY